MNTEDRRELNIVVGYILLTIPFFAVSYKAWQMGGIVRHDLLFCVGLLSIGAAMKKGVPKLEVGGLVTFVGVMYGLGVLHDVGGWPRNAFWAISVSVIVIDMVIKRVGDDKPSSSKPAGNPCGEIM